MEKYYVSGCKDNGSETVTCDDNEAQFWTLYVRDDAGLSQGIIDLEFREDAETAMAVYVERDALQEQVRALATERDASRKAIAEIYMAVIGGRPGWSNWHAYLDDIVEEVVTAIREIRAQARAEGIYFAANRLLAAWESGFVDDTPAAAHDISGAILSAVEFLPNADEGEFKRDYADEVRARIRAGEKS